MKKPGLNEQSLQVLFGFIYTQISKTYELYGMEMDYNQIRQETEMLLAKVKEICKSKYFGLDHEDHLSFRKLIYGIAKNLIKNLRRKLLKQVQKNSLVERWELRELENEIEKIQRSAEIDISEIEIEESTFLDHPEEFMTYGVEMYWRFLKVLKQLSKRETFLLLAERKFEGKNQEEIFHIIKPEYDRLFVEQNKQLTYHGYKKARARVIMKCKDLSK